jgi:hypothetical protein
VTVRISTAVLAVVLVAIGFVLVPQWQDLQDARQRTDDRHAALVVARTEVQELTTLSPTTLDAALKRLNGRLTGSFSQQFQAMFSTFATVVKKQQVTSRGSIQSAGLTSLTNQRAVALVAARAVVSNPAHKSGVRRNYRFEVSLTHRGSRWLVSGMRFVS